jgi:hypothetical protein
MLKSERGLCSTPWIVVWALVVVIGSHATAQDFTRIADLNTPVPGGTGTFLTLTQPQVHRGNIVFGGGGAGASGIYRFDPTTGTRSVVLDGSAALPGGGSPNLNTFSVYGSDVSFLGFSQASSSSALFTTRGGLHLVPGTGNPFTEFGRTTSMDATRILYPRTYTRGTINPFQEPGAALVNPDGTISPFGTTPVHRYVARDGGLAVADHFRYAGTTGNYRIWAGGIEWWFADGSTPTFLWSSHKLPGEPDTGHSWSGGPPIFSYDGDTLVFFAQASSGPDLANTLTQKGIYTKDAGGNVRTVVNDDTPIPGGTGTFTTFANVTIDNGNVVFLAGPSAASLGIFAASGGTVTEVIGVGDTLDGKTVSALSFSGDRPLSGSDLVFTAEFTDGSRGLFLTQVPEPAAVGCVAAAVFLFARRRG